jgi:predicted transcriptional regulator/transcriptional regulator with XRE-family HTH domain
MSEVQIGWRVRQLRRQRGLSQTALAEAIGISSSYLNLIEHNRRKVTVPLLFSLAGQFGVEPGDLADGDEARLIGDLMEAFGDEVFADVPLTNLEVRDLAVTNAPAAKAMLRLYAGYRAAKTAGGSTVDADESDFHTSTDLVSDVIQANSNHFPTLEAAAERVRDDIDVASSNFDQGLEGYLANVFGVRIEIAALPTNVAVVKDGESRLRVADSLGGETARFLIARHLAELVAPREIDQIIAQSELAEGDAPLLLRNALTGYFAAALIMPYDRFLRDCIDLRYDFDRLCRRYGASFEQVCHRATSLQRPGKAGIPLHLVRTDVAGNISKRFSLSGLHIPRHSGACPKWNIYSAFLSPDRVSVQVSQAADGSRYFCLAKTVLKGTLRYGGLRRYLSIGIGCSINYARQMVYSDGVDLDNESQIVTVGSSCRVCPRLDCDHRAHPPARHRFSFDGAARSTSIYTRM